MPFDHMAEWFYTRHPDVILDLTAQAHRPEYLINVIILADAAILLSRTEMGMTETHCALVATIKEISEYPARTNDPDLLNRMNILLKEFEKFKINKVGIFPSVHDPANITDVQVFAKYTDTTRIIHLVFNRLDPAHFQRMQPDTLPHKLFLLAQESNGSLKPLGFFHEIYREASEQNIDVTEFLKLQFATTIFACQRDR